MNQGLLFGPDEFECLNGNPEFNTGSVTIPSGERACSGSLSVISRDGCLDGRSPNLVANFVANLVEFRKDVHHTGNRSARQFAFRRFHPVRTITIDKRSRQGSRQGFRSSVVPECGLHLPGWSGSGIPVRCKALVGIPIKPNDAVSAVILMTTNIGTNGSQIVIEASCVFIPNSAHFCNDGIIHHRPPAARQASKFPARYSLLSLTLRAFCASSLDY